MIRKFVCITTLALATACGGTETTNDPANTPNGNNTQNQVDPTFQVVFDDVIKTGCSCHLGATGAGGLAMPDVVTAYSALVDQPATAGGPCAGGQRVDSGSPDTSVLYRKLAGTDLCGAQMPLNGPALSADKLELVRAWIAGGAVEQ